MGDEAASKEVTNSLGIPTAEFVQNVEEYLNKNSYGTSKEAIQKLDELFMKYSLMEQNLSAKKAKLNRQIPEIENNIQVLDFLAAKSKQNEEYETTYLLDCHLYSRAKVEPSTKVGLWLGANVMLEYPIDEAKTLLTKNLQTAEKNLKNLAQDLDFVKDQITTTEVNIARIYNWSVLQRKLTTTTTEKGDEPQTESSK